MNKMNDEINTRIQHVIGETMNADAMITTVIRPEKDTVIYDGECRLCRLQIRFLRWLDARGDLRFVSLHDPEVTRDFPELTPESLMRQMYVVDKSGRARGGVYAVRFLTRRLPLLWPIALPLHAPGSLPLWSLLYNAVARNRHRIMGACREGTCRPRGKPS